ncbi:DUF2130 domain-containing protein [Candidatus Phytoplasma pini]|uniref:DUF2130 domain-containing protein n=1 Tax=Candidatus Phytoplasma pini TaxID=267362 RepID=A0A559KJ79_9MOLU|nr:DUF2130 domain-containing protein [Candidatus Phytoplasma pini]TVY12169.1 hypothetical protein MDPP_00291 [Candidatus Phytoplasma pini]
MKIIKAKINPDNKYELILQEKAYKNDKIDLKNCEIDWSRIIQSDIIQENEKKFREKIYNAQIETNQLEIKIQKQELEYEKKIQNQENKISQLKRERSNSNIKLLGENLEKWCDNEINNQILVLDNISWFKDNILVKNKKGDFIYKVYLNKNKLENEILTSVMLEMKTEIKNNNSNNKNKNSNYFRRLDSNRQNKNLEFAILVSELEWEQDNDLPIKKVNDYDKMYIVRPPYLITFLNIITALAMKYKELINNNRIQKIKFQSQQNIMNKFEKIKNEILDNYLQKIKNSLNKLFNNSQKIKESAKNILQNINEMEKETETILKKHFIKIIDKINNFKINEIINQIV